MVVVSILAACAGSEGSSADVDSVPDEQGESDSSSDSMATSDETRGEPDDPPVSSVTAPNDTEADVADADGEDIGAEDTAADVEEIEADDEEVETAENPDDEAAATRYASGDSTFLFDPEVVHTFDIGLEPEALDELDSDPGAEEYVEGSLTFDGETLERVGVRYKGSVGAFLGCTSGPNPFVPSGPKTCTKLSFKLKINWDGADTEFYGQRRVQLHAMNLDESMMRDRLGYEMFRSAGVPAPRATHARVNVNGEFVGVFILVEQIDGRFVRDRFDDGSGNLYKEVWPFDDSGDVRSADELVDGLKTNEDEDPKVDIMQSFAEELLDGDAASDPEAARRILGERTDLDAFMTYAVVDRAIRHDDGPFHWYCVQGPCEPHNFYFYEEPATERIHIIPWDLDNALRLTNPITDIADGWGETSNDCEPFPFGPIGIPQRSAACDPLAAAWASLDTEFAEADAAFRAGPFAPQNVRDLIGTWAAQIEPLVAEAAAASDDVPTVDEWRAGVERLVADFAGPDEQES